VKGVTADHFERIVAAFRPTYARWEAVLREHPGGARVGPLILDLSQAMLQAQPHGNLLLGHILLFSPVFVALAENPPAAVPVEEPDLWARIGRVLDGAVPEDAQLIVRAVQAVQPTGLGKVDTLDANHPETEASIISRGITPSGLMAMAPEFDLIAREYALGYRFTRSVVLPLFRAVGDLTEPGLLVAFLSILAVAPDAHVWRKHGQELAHETSQRARALLSAAGWRPRWWEEVSRWGHELTWESPGVQKFNDWLIKTAGGINPGTTADFVALGVLFRTLT
jgi:triphosphoribosyl-dephospho-CoA synthetase